MTSLATCRKTLERLGEPIQQSLDTIFSAEIRSDWIDALNVAAAKRWLASDPPDLASACGALAQVGAHRDPFEIKMSSRRKRPASVIDHSMVRHVA
jgi:hypothetical protein